MHSIVGEKLEKHHVALVMLVFSLLLPLIFPANVSGSADTIYSVAYIYATDLTTAQKFRSLLLSYGISVDLVASSAAETWDYSTYGLIIIGHDTGNLGQWDPSTAVPVINAAGKPILALGRGGYAFFGKLGLAIGYPNGWHGNGDSTYVMDASHRIFNQPISVSVPTNRIIELYSERVPLVEINLEPPISPTITVLGRSLVSQNHYNIVREGRYLLWGFHASPDYLTQTGKNLFINTVLWLLGWEAPSLRSVAFIYSTDLDGAQSFEDLLEDNGITVDLVPKANAEAWGYSGYGVIIIGSDTAYGYDWGPESTILAINAAGKPILGLGYGGSSFFQELGLYINWGHSATGFATSAYVLYPEHQIFNFPNTISIPASRVIQLYSTAVPTLFEYVPSPQPGVNPLAQGVGYISYYLILQEDARYVLWGFTASPAYMTQTGRELFVNIITWMLGYIIPEFPSNTILTAILVISTAAILLLKKRDSSQKESPSNIVNS